MVFTKNTRNKRANNEAMPINTSKMIFNAFLGIESGLLALHKSFLFFRHPFAIFSLYVGSSKGEVV